MTEILKTVLSLSLSGSLLILLLFMLRPVIKARLSKRWQYYIWLVVAARLMLPFAPEERYLTACYGGRRTLQGFSCLRDAQRKQGIIEREVRCNYEI